MLIKQRPLLCELHAHTTWSDGRLGLRDLCDLCDLRGQSGFDVLAVTYHVAQGAGVLAKTFDAYLAAIDAECERALRKYDLLVVPGLELTCDDADPTRSGHALAIGLRSFVEVADGLESALRGARAHGAALVAAHPYLPEELRRRRAAQVRLPSIRRVGCPSSTASSSSTANRSSPGSPTRRLEDAAAVLEARARRRRVPVLVAARVPRAARVSRRNPPRCGVTMVDAP